ncbi:MAG: hypothetical protein AAF702_08455 [Chloroflexota bacterium]
MPTTAQMLASYPDVLIQVIAELRGAFLDAADNREEAIELVAAQITEPTSTQFAYQEVIDYSKESTKAFELLLREGGQMVEAHFAREYGSIRQMGPAKLERESPWLYPENVAELLYYYGLLGRGIKGTGGNAHTTVYLPSDVIPWLPQPQGESSEGGLAIQPIPPPPASRTIPADDSFLEDMGTFLGFLRSDTLRLNGDGPNAEDMDRFVQRLQLPFGGASPELNVRLALLLHLANRLGWLRRGEGSTVHITGDAVRSFLESPRPEQFFRLWDTWCQSTEWNDLCRTPSLECTETGGWKNNPWQTRKAALNLFAGLQPGFWYSVSDFVDLVQKEEPDFQRPNGNYDLWYIRDAQTQEFLKGFEHWRDVEGALLRFYIMGPMHWLSAIDLAEPSAGDDMQFALSQYGAKWLGHDVTLLHEQRRRPMIVGEDFTITMPNGFPLSDRFRVERFAQWQASYPQYVYQINKRSLTQAAEVAIRTSQILDFLKRTARQVPPEVVVALEKFDLIQ